MNLKKKSILFFILLVFVSSLNNNKFVYSIPTQDQICFDTFYINAGYVPTSTSVCSVSGFTCDNGNVKEINITQMQNGDGTFNLFSGSNIKCFYYLNKLTLINFNLDEDFLTNSTYYANVLSEFYEVNIISPMNYTIGQIVPNIVTLRITPNTIYTKAANNIIPLDYFKNVITLNLIDNSPNVGNQEIQFSSQTVQTTVPKDYILFSKSLPLLDMMNINSIKVVLQNGYTFSNLDSYSIPISIDISSTSISDSEIVECIEYTKIQSNIQMNVSELNLNLCFYVADFTNKLNMTINYPNLNSLSINSSKVAFTHPTFFFNSLPSSLKTFTLQNSKFNDLNTAFSTTKNIENVIMNNNNLSGIQISSYILNYNLNKQLDISNNGLSGQLDDSYCKVQNLNVSYNSLTGALPDCFICYWEPSFVYRFIGNSFTNLADASINKCDDKIVPYLYIDYVNQYLILGGKNLGFNASGIVISGYTIEFNMMIPNQLFYANYSTFMGKPDQVFNIVFSIPSKTFALRTIKHSPTITKVDTDLTNVTIYGSDFSYNKSLISVKIGDFDCIIGSSTYNQIDCQVNGPLTSLTKDMISYISVYDENNNNTTPYTTQILINFDPNGEIYESNVIMCQDNCNNNGVCLTNNGTCKCELSGDASANCLKTCAAGCGEVSLNGQCNNTVCQCFPGFQGPVCNDPLKQCPSNSPTTICSGSGTCNNQTGICTCDSTHQGNDCSTAFIQCPMVNNKLCSGLGSCSNQTGICTCDDGQQGIDCSFPFIQCPIDDYGQPCSNLGSCNNQTGICTCDDGYQSKDCSIQLIPCLNDCTDSIHGTCNNQTGVCTCSKGYVNIPYNDCSGIECALCQNYGKCNYLIGQCQCTSNWKGTDCTTPIHYISSIDPCSIKGGQVTIRGWFSNIHQDLSILIGSLQCIPDPNITDSTITCTLGAGQGTKDVNITQNGISFYSKDKFQYYNPIINCLNNCSSNGQCDTTSGQCVCNSQYTGFDCSSPFKNSGSNQQQQDIPVSVTKVDITQGLTSISNQDTKYEISIISLIELDISGKEIRQILLQNTWNNVPTNIDGIYQFSQTISNTGIPDDSNTTSTIIYTIEEVKSKSINYEFGGLTLTIDQGAVKVSVNITNYPYQNALNTLQLRFLSSSSTDTSGESSSNQCNVGDSKSDTSNIDPNQTLNYISIVKNSKQLRGRFINKVVSDGIHTFMSSEVVKDLSNSSTIVVGLNLPHCTSECLIDPDFSVLVTSSFKSKCDDGSNSKNNWVVPVAVVIPVVAIVALCVIGSKLYKKHRYSIKLFFLKKNTGRFRNSFRLRKKNLYGYKD